jgi:CheY-like chemotaxis protein
MGVRILVADDAAFIRDMVKKQLRDKVPGLELNEAADGARAWALIKQWNPDLVLSDWEMPNMSGAELLQAIRGSEQHATLPFIMITSRGDREHVVKAVQSGVSDYITKPFTAEELLRKVGNQLKKMGKLAQAQAVPKSQMMFSSVELLTGSSPPKTPAKESPVQSPLINAKEPPPTKVSSSNKCKAQLRFPNNLQFACVIREMNLQLMSCVIERADTYPQIFDQAVVDMELDDGSLARVNAYVHALQAIENRPDARAIKLILRFVDNDPAKFETLSKFIAKLN